MTKKAKAYISKKIRILIHEGYPQQQAIAIAHNMARKIGYKVPKINPKVISMIPYSIWRQLPYRRQKQILEFIDGYTNVYGLKQVKLVPALIHMFDMDEDTANYAIDLYKKIKPKGLRKNRERSIVSDPHSVKAFWNRFDIFLKRMVELTVNNYRKQGISEDMIAKNIVREFALSTHIATSILTNIFPLSKNMRSNPIRRNSAGTVKIYDTILAIEARKGSKNESLWPNENFRHDFKGSKAAIYGLDDGSILIKSQNGKRLWNTFDYNEEDI